MDSASPRRSLLNALAVGFALLFAAASLLVVVKQPGGITGAAIFLTNGSGGFADGSFNQSYFNATSNAFQLNTTYTSANYTSKVFNASVVTQWLNISWVTGPYQMELPDG